MSALMTKEILQKKLQNSMKHDIHDKLQHLKLNLVLSLSLLISSFFFVFCFKQKTLKNFPVFSAAKKHCPIEFGQPGHTFPINSVWHPREPEPKVNIRNFNDAKKKFLFFCLLFLFLFLLFIITFGFQCDQCPLSKKKREFFSVC